jgi:hypothetical protein
LRNFFKEKKYNKPFLDRNGQDCGIISVDKITRSSAEEKMPPEVTRKCLRYPVDWEVKTCNGHPVAQTLLLDISAIGTRIEGPQPLYQQRHVEFTFLIPGDDRAKKAYGEVMWMRPWPINQGVTRWG